MSELAYPRLNSSAFTLEESRRRLTSTQRAMVIPFLGSSRTDNKAIWFVLMGVKFVKTEPSSFQCLSMIHAIQEPFLYRPHSSSIDCQPDPRPRWSARACEDSHAAG
jgi:hypothetical protein